MSQHDMEIATTDANTGATFRAAVNAALQALCSLQSGASAPGTVYGYMFWADTGTNLLKIASSGSSAWQTIGPTTDLKVPSQIFTAQGDMIYANAAKASTRLAKGSDPGDCLMLNSAATTIPSWGRPLPVRDSARNLVVMNSTSSGTHRVDINADEIILQDTSGVTRRYSGVDITVNIETSGANGRSTTITESSANWFSLWAISKGTTAAPAGLISTVHAATSLTLPASYTMSAYVGDVWNSSVSNFITFFQHGNMVTREPATVIANSTINTSTVTVDLSAFCPPTARVIGGNLSLTNNTGSAQGVYVTISPTSVISDPLAGVAIGGYMPASTGILMSQYRLHLTDTHMLYRAGVPSNMPLTLTLNDFEY